MILLTRLFALVTGLALMFSGINFAAAVGDILFAVPTLCLGGLQLLYAASGSYPRRWMSPSGVTHRLTNVEGSSHP